MSNRLLETLKQNQHPQDPQVIKTRSPFAFECIREPYQAAIWERPKAEKDSLREKFRLAAGLYPAQTGLTEILRGQADSDGHVRFEHIEPPLIPVKNELQNMADTYHRITGKQDIEIFMLTNFQIDEHIHDGYAVLNCTWDEENGLSTCWKNAQGEELQAGEGNWFFFERNFLHYSPTAPESARNTNRLTVIVKEPG